MKKRETVLKIIGEKTYNAMAIVLMFFVTFMFVNLAIVNAADMRGLPTQTKFHTGSPYYKGGDASGLNTNPNERILRDFVNYSVGNIKTKKIYHSGQQQRAVYCLDIETEFPGTTAELYNYRGNLMDGNFHIPQIVNGQEQFINVDETMRGQLRWLFDQFYIRENQDKDIMQAVKKNLFDNLAKYELKKAGNSNPTLAQIHQRVETMGLYKYLSDSDIEVAQQWAVWSIVNKQNAPAFNGGAPSTTESLATLSPTELNPYANLRIKLHSYLVETAETKNGSYKNAEIEPVVKTDTETKTFVDGINSFAIYGYSVQVPINDTNNSNDKSLVTEIDLIDKDGNIIPRSKYEIGVYKEGANIDFSKTLPSDRTLWDVVNEDRFFILFPVTSEEYITDKSTITLRVKYRNIVTYPFVYVPDNRNTPDPMQSVVMLDRDAKSKEFVHTVATPIGYDLALRKSIIAINGESNFPSRLPKIDTSLVKLTNPASPGEELPDEQTTAKYMHPKNPLRVKKGDIITYEFNIYNEDRQDKALGQIKDLLPKNLKLVPPAQSEINRKFGWQEAEAGRIIIANLTNEQGMLKGATEKQGGGININGKVTLQVQLYVTSEAVEGEILTNIAEITADTPVNKDRDSVVNNIPLNANKYTDQELQNYRGITPENVPLNDPNYHYKGQQDDDDFEKLIVYEPKLDLSLRKFITTIQDPDNTSREFRSSRTPGVDVSPLKNRTNTTANYTKNTKWPGVYNGSVVTYTLRIFNDGEFAGYANKVKDNIPDGLEFLPEHEINKKYRWVQEGNELVSDYLSFEQEKETGRDNLIKPFDPDTGTALDFRDLEIVFKVKSDATPQSDLRNIAEIKEHKDENGNDIAERDSTPDNNVPGEDDIDYEDLKLKEFDLNLKKFITKINSSEITSRIPVVNTTPLKEKTSTNAEYKQIKDPILVAQNDEVEYTIRVYNEGATSGYAEEVRDTIPEDVEFVLNHPTNKKYGWKMYDSSGKETSIAMEATEIRTNYLSKSEGEKRGENNLIKGFDGGDTLDFRDIQVVFKIKQNTKPSNQMKLKNIAEITDHQDEDGDKPKDRDSTPDNNNPDEDDQDYEDLVVKVFDLALRKFILQINGREPKVSREPKVNVEKLESSTTAEYTHPKDPLLVNEGDIVEYVIRIYNEGEEAGYAKEVKDYLPEGLEFLPDNATNKEYRWKANGDILTTDYLSKVQGEEAGRDNLIKGYDRETKTLHYRDLKVVCKVKSGLIDYKELEYYKPVTTEVGTTSLKDETVNTDNINESKQENNNQENNNIELEDKVLGLVEVEDSNNFSRVTTEMSDRLKNVQTLEDLQEIVNEQKLEIEEEKIMAKWMLNFFETFAEVNEKAANQLEIKEYIQTETQQAEKIIEDNEDKKITDKNAESKTETINKNQLITEKSAEETKVEVEQTEKKEGIVAKLKKENLDKKTLITKLGEDGGFLKNIAEISKHEDENGNEVIQDRDSTPDNKIKTEDDIDYEQLRIGYFDLSLLKIITDYELTIGDKVEKVNTGHTFEMDPEPLVSITTPKVDASKIKLKYKYKIQIKNEGMIPGSATEIKDYIPRGLVFHSEDNPLWKEIEPGIVVTEQLKDVILQPGETRVVEIVLRWDDKLKLFNVLTNVAEISKDWNEFDLDDIDSTPDNKRPGEDDIDDASVVLTIETGAGQTFFTIVLCTSTFIGMSAQGIRKYII